MTEQIINKRSMSLHRAVFHALRIHRMRAKGEKILVPWIVSPPGCGKTEMTLYYSKKTGLAPLAYEPGLERPEKFGGIPDLFRISNKEGKEELVTEWSVPELISNLRRKSEDNPDGVICLFDDMHLCDEYSQSINFELLTHYSLNGHKVPNNVSFIFAGNDTPMAGARLQFSAIRNRATILNTYPDVNFWLDNYAIPSNCHPSIIGFFSDPSNKMYLLTEESTTEQFASPRSWVQGVSANLNDIDNSIGVKKLDKEELCCIIEGCIGPVAGNKFLEFLLYYSNIDVDKLFNKGIVDIPDLGIEKFGYCIAVTNELYKRKARDIDDSKSGKNYSKALEEFVNHNRELAVKSLFFLCEKREDEKLGNPSGVSVVVDMAKKKEINPDLLSSLPRITEIIKSF